MTSSHVPALILPASLMTIFSTYSTVPAHFLRESGSCGYCFQEKMLCVPPSRARLPRAPFPKSDPYFTGKDILRCSNVSHFRQSTTFFCRSGHLLWPIKTLNARSRRCDTPRLILIFWSDPGLTLFFIITYWSNFPGPSCFLVFSFSQSRPSGPYRLPIFTSAPRGFSPKDEFTSKTVSRLWRRRSRGAVRRSPSDAVRGRIYRTTYRLPPPGTCPSTANLQFLQISLVMPGAKISETSQFSRRPLSSRPAASGKGR